MRIIIALLFVALTSPASAQTLPGGFTCEQVRKLKGFERRYLIARLGLTNQQVEQIKAHCKLK